MHEKVAKLVIERATVIFNLLARHLTRWSCRASERYNVLARTGPAVWKVRRARGPVLMLRAVNVSKMRRMSRIFSSPCWQLWDEYNLRLSKTKLLSLEMRRLRLRSDLIEVFKIMHNLEGVKREDFFQQRTATGRRGHSLTILKQHCRLNARKYFFTHRVVDTWNKSEWGYSEQQDSEQLQKSDWPMVQTTRWAIHKPAKASFSHHSDPQTHRNQLAETSGSW